VGFFFIHRDALSYVSQCLTVGHGLYASCSSMGQEGPVTAELIVAASIFAAGFGSGYLVRHRISSRRRRAAERRHGLI
jgi:hypothetical protein